MLLLIKVYNMVSEVKIYMLKSDCEDCKASCEL